MRACAAALLLAASSAHAFTHDTGRFVVTDNLFDAQDMAGDTLIWRQGGSGSPPILLQSVPAWGPDQSLTVPLDLTWMADPGFGINGFAVAFDLSLDTSSYQFTGDESPSLGQPGSTFTGFATIDGSGFQRVTVTGNTPSALPSVQVVGSSFTGNLRLAAFGLSEFCTTTPGCLDGFADGGVATTLYVRSVRITPMIAILQQPDSTPPVPEPASWAMLLAGLLGLTGLAIARALRVCSC